MRASVSCGYQNKSEWTVHADVDEVCGVAAGTLTELFINVDRMWSGRELTHTR